MSTLAAPLKRYFTVLVTVLAAAAVTLTMLVAAPQAQARPYKMHCTIANHRVHRGDHDRAHCIHAPKNHSGIAYVVQKERHRVGRRHHRHWKTVYKMYVLGKFQSNRLGVANVPLRIPYRLRLGFHWVHFKCRHQSTKDNIAVVRG